MKPKVQMARLVKGKNDLKLDRFGIHLTFACAKPLRRRQGFCHLILL